MKSSIKSIASAPRPKSRRRASNGRHRETPIRKKPETLAEFTRSFERHASRSVADQSDGPSTAGNL